MYIKRYLLVDTKALMHTVKFSLGKNRLSHNEKDTFIIYGFLLKLLYMIKKSKTNMILYALDSETSKRKEIYSIYKESRQKKTQQQIELDQIAYPQFDEIEKFVIPTMGFRNLFEAEGFEADDIIGSICKNNKQDQIIIATSDKDMYQLLTNNVCIFDIRTNTWYTITDFRKEYGIEPKYWKRVKAIGGCSSDNVKGVPIPQDDPTKKQMCVAEKGALNYLLGKTNPNTKAYKAIESREGKDVINRNKKLVIIPFKGTPNFPIRKDKLSEKGLKEVCEKYGFNSILEDFETWKRTFKLR